MNAGTVIDIGLWVACSTCAFEAAAAFVRLARTEGGHRDAGSWHAPLIFTSGTLALLGLLGALGPGAAAALAAVPLLVVAAVVARAWREAARVIGRRQATALILSGLARRVREALWHTWQDARELTGLLRRGESVPGPDGRPAGGLGRASARPRRTPSVWNDPALGPVPVPEQVHNDLVAASVAVPSAWGAVAERIAFFEPEDGEDLRGHIAENAAGILTAAGALQEQAENLAEGNRLDPAFISALLEFADDFADTASSAAMVIRVYDNAYNNVHEHVDDGGTLPQDARTWFGAGGPADGQAA